MIHADMSAMRGFRRPAGQFAASRGVSQVGGLLEPLIHRFQASPDGVARLIPIEFVRKDQAPRRDTRDDDPRQESVARRESQIAGRFPTAAARVMERRLGIVGQRIAGFRLRASEVEGHDGRNALVEHAGDGRRIAAACDGSQQRDLVVVNARLSQQQINAAAQVPGELADQAFARQMQLDAVVIAKIVILPTHAKLFGIVGGRRKWMRAPLAVPELIHHQHQATQAGPGHAHILQFTVRFGCMMAVTDQDAGHGLPGRYRAIKVGGNPQPRPAVEDDIVDRQAVAADGPCDMHLQRQGFARQE
jgi:hypothetical protein